MSSDFKDGATLPISSISEYALPNGTNGCSINGATGGNESPQLSWKDPPPQTRSFVLVVYDATGAYVHWGLYGISAETRSLPQNAGVAGTTYGLQVYNVFNDQSYDGPCPPADYPPNNHRYVFTVYALDKELDVYSPADFPATGQSLLHSLLEASLHGHVLATASITGFYSTTPASN